jgi:hypothetical protein
MTAIILMFIEFCNCWNILGLNFTKRDALSSVYKISMVQTANESHCFNKSLLLTN